MTKYDTFHLNMQTHTTTTTDFVWCGMTEFPSFFFYLQFFHLAMRDEVGPLTNSYVQPYSCYELGCVLLNTPEVSSLCERDRERLCLVLSGGGKVTYSNESLILSPFPVCLYGSHALASGQGTVHLCFILLIL